MKFTGRLKEPIIDYLTGRLTILFEPCEDFRQTYEELKGCEKLSLEIKRYRRKRSLDANAYYWVLVTKLANALGETNQEMHNKALRQYGQPEIVDGREVLVYLPDTDEARYRADNASEYHLDPTSELSVEPDGSIFRIYRLLRGSRTYNTAEMTRLINGMITMCREAMIPDAEIATPDEKRLLKEMYGVEL